MYFVYSAATGTITMQSRRICMRAGAQVAGAGARVHSTDAANRRVFT